MFCAACGAEHESIPPSLRNIYLRIWELGKITTPKLYLCQLKYTVLQNIGK